MLLPEVDSAPASSVPSAAHGRMVDQGCPAVEAMAVAGMEAPAEETSSPERAVGVKSFDDFDAEKQQQKN
jgi:hypothetical protein